jgi:hypothetical protein
MGATRTKLSAWLVVLSLGLGCWLSACAEVQVAPPPTWPSIVTSEDRAQYYVSGLRIPGTRQELRTRRGEANLWVPLAQISSMRFTSPAYEDYRSAEIRLVSGELLQVEVDTNQLLEGRTEVGYWNMPMGQIYSLELGTE